LAKNNAKVYDVYHKIKFLVGDFFKIWYRLKEFKADAIVTSPPWGGPTYSALWSLSPTKISIDKILEFGKTAAPKILLHLPKNLDTDEVSTLVFDKDTYLMFSLIVWDFITLF